MTPTMQILMTAERVVMNPKSTPAERERAYASVRALNLPGALANLQDVDFEQKSGHRVRTAESPDAPAPQIPETPNRPEDVEKARDFMRRLSPELHRTWRAAMAMIGVENPDLSDEALLKLRASAWFNDGDIYSTALDAAGLDDTDENRAALKAMGDMMPLVKSEDELPPKNSEVRPLSVTAHDAAEDISSHLGDARVAHLDGKHSKGSFFVPGREGTWFMKPGSGGTGPIEGIGEDPSPSSARESAFWAVTKDWGLDADFSRAEWVQVGDHKYAAIRFLPKTFVPLIDQMAEDPGRISAALESYRQRGRLWQWAVLDWVLGNGDRHGHNLLVNDDGVIKLIDQGSTFAGHHFDPAHDMESFTPYYLRYTVPPDVTFNTLTASEKLRYMPDLPMAAQGRLRTWLAALNPDTLAQTLQRFGIDPQPSLQRLGIAQQAGSDLAGYVNRLWVQG